MLPATVTECACGSNATTPSIAFRDRRWLVLSAILLKQWRVPSTFSLFWALTNSRTCSTELAGYKFSVLYSKLPAQFVTLEAGSRAKSGDTTGPAIIAERILIKLLLSMANGGSPKLGRWNLRLWDNGDHLTLVLFFGLQNPRVKRFLIVQLSLVHHPGLCRGRSPPHRHPVRFVRPRLRLAAAFARHPAKRENPLLLRDTAGGRYPQRAYSREPDHSI